MTSVPPPVHLDFNATTPCDPRVVTRMTPFFTDIAGNASSTHYAAGRVAHDAVESARTEVASLLGCHADEIVFTSGGTESNALALLGLVRERRCASRRALGRKCHVIISTLEHPAITRVCDLLKEEFDTLVTTVSVREGETAVNALDVLDAITPDTVLISVMLANNELGSIQPVAEIGAALRSRAPADELILLHTDAAQAVGKIPVDVNALNVDLLTVVGHKLYAPKGVGCLYVRRGVALRPLLVGGGQESGRRGGTENVPYVVALGEACRIAAEFITPEAMRATAALRDRLYELIAAPLAAHGIKATRNSVGGVDRLLPNTLSVSLRGVLASALLRTVARDVEASAGAACHSGRSQSLMAIGRGAESSSTLRLSLGRSTTNDDIERAAAAIVRAASSMPSSSSSSSASSFLPSSSISAQH
jgi:cysteine desulfurase